MLFYIEVTDQFGGEANYSWVTRHIIKANTKRGAVNKFSRLSGMGWKNEFSEKYVSESGVTCYFIFEYDPEMHGGYYFNTDER